MKLANLALGSKLKFGTYDGNDLTWIVIDQNHEGYPENSTTLLSEYVIGYGTKYHNDKNAWDKRWANSDLRGYLNSEFLNCLDDTSILLNTRLETTSVGAGPEVEETSDLVFCLTRKEVGYGTIGSGVKFNYFTNDALRIANSIDEKDTASYYWLRGTINFTNTQVSSVHSSGGISNVSPVNFTIGIRPAFNISSDIQAKLSDDGYYEIFNPKPTKLGNLEVGSKIKFGTYNDEPISWIVVDQNHEGYPENSTTVFAENPLLQMEFGSNGYWSTSTARSFLNGDFLNGFDNVSKILPTDLDTAVSSSVTEQTTDNVFLLSATEVGNALASYTNTGGATIQFLKSNTSYVYSSGKHYWLRGDSSKTGSYTDMCGTSSLSTYNTPTNKTRWIRPATNLSASTMMIEGDDGYYLVVPPVPNKVDYFGKVLIDLTQDTISPSTVLKGYLGHDASGQQFVGEFEGTEGSYDIYADSTAPASPSDGDIWLDTSGEFDEEFAYKLMFDKFTADDVVKFPSVNKSLTIITSYSLQRKNSINHVIIPDHILSIGNYAFSNCTYLKDVQLPEGLTSIGSYAFEYCTNLEMSELPSSLYTISSYAFQRCPKITISKIPSVITTIPGYCFGYCSAITEFDFHEGITSISSGAFRSTGLRQIVLPSTLTSTNASYCFGDCQNLEEVTFKSKPTTISTTFFYNDTALTTINVPWSEGEVSGAPWGATNATINYNYTGE